MRHRLIALTAAASTLLATTAAVESRFTATASPGRSAFDAAGVFPPRNLTPPAVSGTAREGETLSATTGTWARGTTSTAVTWLRCASDGACTEVGTGPTRELTAADVGYTMRVRVEATNAGGTTAATSPPTGTVAAMAPPVTTAPPTVAGSSVVGGTLTATDGAWTGDRLTLTRRWLRCTAAAGCVTIPGETDRTYEVTGDDAGATLRVAVRAVNARGDRTATSATTAVVARATFTQILCANPDTGQGAGADGSLPAGFSVGGTLPDRGNTPASSRCAPGGSLAGIPLSTGATFSTTVPDDRLVLAYRTGTGMDFVGATLYRHATMSGQWSWGVQMSTSATGLFSGPHAEICSWSAGCGTRGSASTRFGAQNRVDVFAAFLPGFNVTLSCDVPDASRRCDADGSQVFRLFGGKATIRDTATPKLTTVPTGTLVTGSSLAATETLAFAADDVGSGLYRLRITIDGTEVERTVLSRNGGQCVDQNPANADAYEFAAQRPCPASLSASLQYDTSAWPRTGRLRVYLEDAGRNTTVVANRELGG